MAQKIQIKRRIGSAGAPPTLLAGEIAYHRLAAAGAAAGPDDLYVGDGTNVHPLVSAARQVELAGAQTIAGVKTFSALPSFPGGGAGNVLTTDGAGALSWVATPPATVLVDDPLTGTGATGSELSVTMATGAQITTGTDDVFPVSSAGLRTQLGAAASAVNLGTTAATIVPAIKELSDKVVTLTGAVVVVGNYNATAHQVNGLRPPAAPGLAENAVLPPAQDSNRGWVFLVNTAGTGAVPAPVVPMAIGDWLISSGAGWVHLAMGLTSIAGGNVSAIPPGAGAPENTYTTVQAFLTGLWNTSLRTVAVDDVSITGDGTAGDPLEVDLVDAGTY